MIKPSQEIRILFINYLLKIAYLDTNEELDDIDDEDEEVLEDDMPPEVPKRTSSKGVGSVPLTASSTSASGRSSAGSMSIRGQVKSVGNGVANTESRQPRICSATGRPLVVSLHVFSEYSLSASGEKMINRSLKFWVYTL